MLTTWGSFGDLHPYLALALELRSRGHRPVIATSGIYRPKVEGEGIEFHAVRPDLPLPEEAPDWTARVMDPARGTRAVIEEMIVPHVRESYADLSRAAEGADLIVSHPVTYAAPLVAATRRLPWVSTALQPMVFCSVYDPPIPPQAPGAAFLFRLGPAVNARIFALVKNRMRKMVGPVDALRADLGLPPGANPIFEGQHSPTAALGLFSPLFGPPQPDWPASARAVGFPFYDRLESGAEMPVELDRFLAVGEPPVVFTLGTSAVMTAGDFYRASLEAVRTLGRRAVFLVGSFGRNGLPERLPDGMIACAYAPHGELFPRAAAVVHQCGVGTTAQALRAGRPMLCVPFAHDQPDNATRCVRLGAGRVLQRRRYTGQSAARALASLLADPVVSARAAEVGGAIARETGVADTCDVIESVLAVPCGVS